MPNSDEQLQDLTLVGVAAWWLDYYPLATRAPAGTAPLVALLATVGWQSGFVATDLVMPSPSGSPYSLAMSRTELRELLHWHLGVPYRPARLNAGGKKFLARHPAAPRLARLLALLAERLPLGDPERLAAFAVLAMVRLLLRHLGEPATWEHFASGAGNAVLPAGYHFDAAFPPPPEELALDQARWAILDRLAATAPTA